MPHTLGRRIAMGSTALAVAAAVIAPMGAFSVGSAALGAWRHGTALLGAGSANPLVGGSAAARYTVRPGDTLTGIASRMRVPASALASANNIADPNRIIAGKVLTIPASNPAASNPAASNPAAAGATAGPTTMAGTGAATTYTVRPGDTLSAIAQRTGVSQSALAEANGILDPSRIAAGTRLIIPGGWHCPVTGRPTFVNDFGYVKPETGIRHDGIDIFAARNTPVVAPVGGIAVSTPNPLGGLAIRLQGADGARYYLAHLERLGATGRVSAGSVVGYVGNSGNARFTAPHLHFEMYREDDKVENPYTKLVSACQ